MECITIHCCYDILCTALFKALFHVPLLYFEHLPLLRSLHGPAEKAQKYPLRLHQHTMSQQSTSCWIRRYNRQYIVLPQFTLVSRCRARDEKFLSQTLSQASSAIAANSVSSLPQQRLDPSRGGQMIAPILSRKRDNRERSFFPQKKGSQ